MKKYRVAVEVWKYYGVYVEANSPEEAEAMVQKRFDNREFIDYDEEGDRGRRVCYGETDMVDEDIELTEEGRCEINKYVQELKAKRKEIIDAGLDTADETNIPDETDIITDIECSENEDEYIDCWSCTDHYEMDYPLNLKRGIHYIHVETGVII